MERKSPLHSSSTRSSKGSNSCVCEGKRGVEVIEPNQRLSLFRSVSTLAARNNTFAATNIDVPVHDTQAVRVPQPLQHPPGHHCDDLLRQAPTSQQQVPERTAGHVLHDQANPILTAPNHAVTPDDVGRVGSHQNINLASRLLPGVDGVPIEAEDLEGEEGRGVATSELVDRAATAVADHGELLEVGEVVDHQRGVGAAVQRRRRELEAVGNLRQRLLWGVATAASGLVGSSSPSPSPCSSLLFSPPLFHLCVDSGRVHGRASQACRLKEGVGGQPIDLYCCLSNAATD
ncbi:hypothetical protein MUK42_00997 [Musa troglodytarum]|uniref:Uncharacterized protein n=1 Tax=Musa troglodytarum TaxID=320322 RepID=A0A9E7K717_9LILI|nr:hypothetical protein MUK42_00997 [Musa troglodytarum]